MGLRIRRLRQFARFIGLSRFVTTAPGFLWVFDGEGGSGGGGRWNGVAIACPKRQ